VTETEFARELEAALPMMAKTAHFFKAPGDNTEDIVQQAAMKAWEHRARFRGGCQMTTWLYKIVRNVVFDKSRKARTRPHEIQLLIANSHKTKWTTGPDQYIDPPDERMVPADLQASKKEQLGKLDGFIQRLSAGDQAAIRLMLAGKMNLEPTTGAKTRYHRALRKLKRMNFSAFIASERARTKT